MQSLNTSIDIYLSCGPPYAKVITPTFKLSSSSSFVHYSFIHFYLTNHKTIPKLIEGKQGKFKGTPILTKSSSTQPLWSKVGTIHGWKP